jgi:site-specific recombinase XerD
MTLLEFYNYWETNYAKTHLTQSTVNYNRHISKRILFAFGDIRLDKINAAMCLAFFEKLRGSKSNLGTKLSDNTIRKHYTLLNELFNFAYKWDLLTDNPLRKVDPPKNAAKQKIMPPSADVAKLLNIVKKEPEIKCRLWVMLAFAIGLRREEIFGLKTQDIDLKTHTINIRRAAVFIPGQGVVIKAPKTKASNRILIMPDIVCGLMGEYLTRLKTDKITHIENWLFTGKNGGIASPDRFNNYLKRLCKTHALPDISPHTLRHLYGSNLIKQGIDLALTSHQLGHSNKSFTADTYIHVTDYVENRAAIAIQNAKDAMTKEQN